MDQILSFASNNWWLIFPVGAAVGGWAGSVAKYNERRRRDKIELARIKANAQVSQVQTQTAGASQIAKVIAMHDQVDDRWMAYELDLATLIEFPLMIDMREPLTQAFHAARARADGLRPAGDGADVDPVSFEKYWDAVIEYRAAFDAAEREARRRKDSGFTPDEREALARAGKLVNVASDETATPAERQLAYQRARSELAGLIDVPAPAGEQLERRIRLAIEGG